MTHRRGSLAFSLLSASNSFCSLLGGKNKAQAVTFLWGNGSPFPPVNPPPRGGNLELLFAAGGGGIPTPHGIPLEGGSIPSAPTPFLPPFHYYIPSGQFWASGQHPRLDPFCLCVDAKRVPSPLIEAHALELRMAE